MARTTAPRDGNRVAGMIAASNDVNETPVVLWADPTTHRLLVDSNAGGDLVAAGDNYNAAYQGSISFGTDGIDYYPIKVDSDGNLQVDVVSGAGGTQYTEADTDTTITGTAIMWEDTSDTLRAVSAAKPLPISVATIPSHAVTNAGVFVVQENGAALTSLQLIDDAILADDVAFTPATTKVIMAGFEFDDSTPDTVDEGDAGAARMSANRNIYVNIRDNAGNERGLNVDANGAIAVTNSGTFVTQENGAALTSLQLIDDVVYVDDTGTHATGTSKGVLFMAAATPTDTSVNANDIGAVAMTTDRKLHVSVKDSLPAGTNGIGKLTSNAGVTIGAVEIAASQTLSTVTTVTTLTGGGIAHDSADSGNPHKMGGKAVDIGTSQTDVTANDRTNWNFTRQGVAFVIGGHPNIVNKHIQVTDADGAQTDAALITVSAGSAIVVTRYSVTLDAATTATGGCAVRMGFGTANTPSVDANAGVLAAHSGIPAGGGIAEGDGSGIIGMGASNEDLRLTCEDPAGGNIDIVISYFVVAIG